MRGAWRLVTAGAMLACSAPQTLPAPTADTLYLLFVPPETNAAATGLCLSNGGFHTYFFPTSDGPAAYAVAGDCGYGLDYALSTASHELIEAATDPILSSYFKP